MTEENLSGPQNGDSAGSNEKSAMNPKMYHKREKLRLLSVGKIQLWTAVLFS